MEAKISKSQLEVWAMKDAIYEQVKHMPTVAEQLKAVTQMAKEAGVKMRAELAAISKKKNA